MQNTGKQQIIIDIVDAYPIQALNGCGQIWYFWGRQLEQAKSTGSHFPGMLCQAKPRPAYLCQISACLHKDEAYGMYHKGIKGW